MYKPIIALLSVLFLVSCSGERSQVTDLTSLPQQLAEAAPGDTILLKEGVYKNIQLQLEGHGKEGQPIVVKAQKPGTVFVEGESNLHLCGEFVEIHGLYFRNGYSPKGAVIEFRNKDKAANNCRITNCAISYFNPASRDSGYNWVRMFGRNNRFDHNSLVGKQNCDVTLVVALNEERDRENHHSIDHNYFGARPILGANGGETIRVGTSHHAFFSSNTLIEGNLFEHCDGEVEIVSIKSSDNIVRNNTFLECAGLLALRHGNRNLVEGNTFIGNRLPNTGGVRVVNEGHIIKNNTFYALTGDRFFAALALMNAVPNSPPNRYHHVKDVLIENNLFADCDNILFCVGKDNERILPPSNVLLKNNQFYHSNQEKVYRSFDDMSGIKFEGNQVSYTALVNQPGFTNTKDKMPSPVVLSSDKRNDFGALWFQLEGEKQRTLSGNVIKVKAGKNTLVEAVKNRKDGDVIELEEAGDYFIDETIPVDMYLRIQAALGLSKRPVLHYNSAKKAAFITIMSGGNLDIEGIAFNGEMIPGKALASAGVSTHSEMITPYVLHVNNCEFFNFNESGQRCIAGLKSTLSPEVTVRNSFFHDMSGEGINYAAEKDDVGKYNVECLIIDNCHFSRMLGTAINVYRGGNDESTSGPRLTVANCTFENVDNKEQGSVVRLLGVQVADINHCSFVDSGRGGASIRFNEMSWDKLSVSDVNLWNSGRISSFWGKVEKGNITYHKPKGL